MDEEVKRLQDAIDRFVRFIGGNIVVIGGPEIRRDPGRSKRFEFAVSFVGNVPEKGND